MNNISNIKEIKNLTPHDIVIIVGKKAITIPPEEVPARVKTEKKEIGRISYNGTAIPINKVELLKDVEGLPEKKKGVIYIVSQIVCQARPDRDDLYVVDATIRNEKGVIVGAGALAQNPYLKNTPKKKK